VRSGEGGEGRDYGTLTAIGTAVRTGTQHRAKRTLMHPPITCTAYTAEKDLQTHTQTDTSHTRTHTQLCSALVWLFMS